MNVKIQKLQTDAVIPKYAKEGDAGLDLTAVTTNYDKDNHVLSIGTGLAVEIPEGYVGLVYPRSSIYKTFTILANSVGVIDSGYRGEIQLKFLAGPDSRLYKVGDKVGQLIIVPYPKIEFQEVEELSSSERGTGGFGSSGL